MKMNWGTGLLVVCLVFVIGMLIMGAIAATRGVDLVTDGYYEKGLRYEDRLEKMRKAKALQQPVETTVRSGEVVVHFPSVGAWGEIGGTITLYRPAGSAGDFAVPIALDSTNTQHISTLRCSSGFWRIQIAWKAGNEEYYSEEAVVVR